MTRAFAYLLLWFFILPSFGQSLRKGYWNASALISANTFLSDLGGKNGDATHDFRDIDYNETNLAIGGGLSYHFKFGLSLNLNNFYTRLTASDANTVSSRTNRMITVRTDLIESNLSLQYTLPKTAGILYGTYFNIGSGIAFYEPKATYKRRYYKLRDLGTEGQLIDPNKSIYKKYAFVVPFGFGKNFYFGNRNSVAIDFSFRKSFSDYLDDVSTTYHDRSEILAKSGVAAAYFSDPSFDTFGKNKSGSIRGNPKHNDTYFLVGLKLNLKLNSSYRRNHPRFYQENWFRKF